MAARDQKKWPTARPRASPRLCSSSVRSPTTHSAASSSDSAEKSMVRVRRTIPKHIHSGVSIISVWRVVMFSETYLRREIRTLSSVQNSTEVQYKTDRCSREILS
jgi:hypothetical protein